MNDQQYIDLVKKVLSAPSRQTRNSKVLSLFSQHMVFDLTCGKLPLLTTKKMRYKTIIKELLWFLSGSTDVSKLNSIIWDMDLKTFQDRTNNKYGSHLGPIYGFQWRHFGGDYEKHLKGEQTGFDQIKHVIKTIKENPTSRRIILNSWVKESNDTSKVALPPCHVLCQFYVRDNFLDAQLYQRSGDLGLGVPFNICSYSLLVYIIANECNLNPGTFYHTIGDCHIYEQHIEGLKEQVKRQPLDSPTVKIANKPFNQLELSDFEINYKSHPLIKLDMC